MGNAIAPAGAAPIVMPKLGLTMSEGLLAEWQVAPGDEVSAGQILFVVETDKIANEVQAPAAGRILEVLVAAGETVAVGRPVALWTGSAQRGPAAAETAAQKAPETRIRSTPLARRLATQAGLALGEITGTGPRGRIQAKDVQGVVDRRAPAPTDPVPERSFRALIAARVTRSKAEIPHFYLTADAEFDALAKLREELNTDPLAPRKVSVTVLLALATARALRLHPDANALWRDERLVPVSARAIGIAVETPAGVMAPVVPVEGGPYRTAEALDAAVGRARAGRLATTDIGEAAIGISNVGMFGVRSLTPIIDPDQSFMLGVGAPHVAFRLGSDGAPRAIREVTLSLACDHRAIDGAAAARFLATIVEGIERPLRLLT